MSHFKKYLVFMNNCKNTAPHLKHHTDDKNNAFLMAEILRTDNPEKEVFVCSIIEPDKKK